MLVLTDARLLFFLRRVTKPSLDLPLGRIESLIDLVGAVDRARWRCAVGENVVAVSRIVKGDVEPLADAIRRAREVAPDVPAPPPDPAEPVDPFEAMAKLSALRDSGVLTEEEFAAKKQELLDRL